MFGIPIEFILFALTLLGVALFHNQTFYVALSGVLAVAIYKIAITGFKTGPGIAGFVGHLGHEWVTLVNLFALLMGFAILARHFEKSHVPVILPKYLPDDWKGAFILLAMVWVISSFLDNIAAAMIGGAMAHQLFKAKVHIGFLAAIVAASNAGGAGSVVGEPGLFNDGPRMANVEAMTACEVWALRGPRLELYLDGGPGYDVGRSDSCSFASGVMTVCPHQQATRLYWHGGLGVRWYLGVGG